MNESWVGRMSWKFVAASLVVVASLIAFSQPAAARDSLTRIEAMSAVYSATADDSVKENLNTFGVESCKRKGPRAFRCVGLGEDTRGANSITCRFRYTVKKRNGSVQVSGRGKKCRTVRLPRLSREAALEAVLAEGMRRANSGMVIESLTRTRRDSFAAIIQWVRKSESGNESCRLDVSVRRTKKMVETASATTPACKPTEEKNNLDNLFQYGPGPKYCPGNAGKTWDARDELIGKTVPEASAIAQEHGCSVRTVIIDGEGQAITMDLRFNRINLEIEGPDELIVGIHGVY